jgi:hypothetical protein
VFFLIESTAFPSDGGAWEMGRAKESDHLPHRNHHEHMNLFFFLHIFDVDFQFIYLFIFVASVFQALGLLAAYFVITLPLLYSAKNPVGNCSWYFFFFFFFFFFFLFKINF